MPVKDPCTALFLNRSPTKLIVACSDGVIIVDVSTQSTQPFSNTPQGVWYRPHALALSDDDAALVAGCGYPYSVWGYDTASLARLWSHDTADSVGAVCMLSAHVLVTVWGNSTLVLDPKTGTSIATLMKAEGYIIGMGVIEGSCFILTSSHLLRSPFLRVSSHAAESPLQASQASTSAAGDVGLDREVSRLDS